MKIASVPILVACLALTAAAILPPALHAEAPAPLPRVIAADEGVVGEGANGFTAHFKVGSLSTGSSKLYVATGIVPPNSETPPHLHEIDEEVIYVLDGEITLMLDGVVHTVGTGGTAFIPPGTWMQLSNRSDRPANLLGVLSRGEVERCFRALYMPADYPADADRRQEDLAACRTRMPEADSGHE